MELKEQIALVNKVDSWAQENDRALDRQFEGLYREADPAHSGDGFSGIAKGNPALFKRCYGLAIQHEDRVPVDFY